MTWIPSAKLYASDGTTLVYTFNPLIDIIGWLKDNPFSVQLQNTRSGKAIIIPGGNKPYDLTIVTRLYVANYTDLTTAIFALQTAIVANTHYILKIDKSISTTNDLHVMRLTEIVLDDKNGKRVRWTYPSITFSVNSW
jgi:hypothetical protein